MPLTNVQVSKAKPAVKATRLFDGGGLYIEVSPKGGKYWRLKYRYGGKEKRLSLGVYPGVSLKEARLKRDEAKQLLARDLDPSEFRKAIKAQKLHSSENSFEAVAREWHQKYSQNQAASTSKRNLSRLERDIFPWLGAQPISEITAPELLITLRRIESRGALESAHRTLRLCGQIFRYAIATGRAERSIPSDLRGALAPVKGSHLAAITEPSEVGPLLRKIDCYKGSFVTRCALKLAPLVFVRPGELRQAQWSHINFDSCEWRYRIGKTDIDHIVPLATQAVEILREIQPLTGSGKYVFPSARTSNGDRPMSDNAVLSALRSMGIEKDKMSGHGFRAMARTILDEELGFRVDLIEHQLAHAVRDPNGRAYNRTKHLPQRVEMMKAWADYLDRLREL